MSLPKAARGQIAKFLKGAAASPYEGVTWEQNVGGVEGKFTFTFTGPAGTPYEGKKFDVNYDLTGGFPNRVPDITFKTKIWHCGVKEDDGTICVAALEPWVPTTGLAACVEHVSGLMNQNDPASMINTVACDEYKANEGAFNAKAKQWAAQYGK
jgi:ubiquitin-protein ligase